MNLRVSPQIRLVALVGVLAAVGLAVGMMALGRGGSPSSAPAKAIKPLHPVHKTTKRVHVADRTAKPTSRRSSKPAATKSSSKPVRSAAAFKGLPAALAGALAGHDVVVVSLSTPNAAVDTEAEKEAQAGASLAGAGFVGFDVLKEPEAKAPSQLLGGVLDAPAVLVFRASDPQSPFVRINGFADRETVAQAAVNAAG